MENQKKKRGLNWSSEEKEILREYISKSASLLENKSNNTNINIRKAKEWLNIKNKFNSVTGNNRSESELKLAWKRMKLAAKSAISFHRQQQLQTGGGEKPPSPLPEHLHVMTIAPQDFVNEINNYDSDAALIHNTDAAPTEIDNAASSTEQINPDLNQITFEPNMEEQVIEVMPKPNKEKKLKRNTRNGTAMEAIVASNSNFKKRQLEMLEIEHKFKIEKGKLEIQKLNLEIYLLERTLAKTETEN